MAEFHGFGSLNACKSNLGFLVTDGKPQQMGNIYQEAPYSTDEAAAMATHELGRFYCVEIKIMQKVRRRNLRYAKYDLYTPLLIAYNL